MQPHWYGTTSQHPQNRLSKPGKCFLKGPQFLLDKNIREHVNQYNLKHRNDKCVWSDKDMTQIPPCQAILLEKQTNRDVHEEYTEDEGYDY